MQQYSQVVGIVVSLISIQQLVLLLVFGLKLFPHKAGFYVLFHVLYITYIKERPIYSTLDAGPEVGHHSLQHFLDYHFHLIGEWNSFSSSPMFAAWFHILKPYRKHLHCVICDCSHLPLRGLQLVRLDLCRII